MMIIILKMLAITSLAISCSSTKADGNADSLNGVWRAEYLEIEGKAASPEEVKSIFVTVNGKRLLVRLDGENSRAKEALIKIDSTKSPGHIDILPADGQAESVLGIYELSKNTLKVCLKADSGTRRPDKFETNANSEQILIVFKKLR
jgi:uncharacterized protein (TIGR03067 family)